MDKYSQFSKFIDDYIRKDEIIKLINILKKDIKTKIKKQINLLSNYIDYMKMFENRFEEAKKESIFEYSIVSLTLVDRKNIKEFEEEKQKCEKRIDKILFHGTGIEPSAKILTDMFKRSEKSGYQYGKELYFTDSLDYAWYNGGINNRANLNKIPKI